MRDLLSYDEYIKLKGKGMNNRQISLAYGARCPAAFGSVMTNCEWISADQLRYKGVEFSADLFKAVPSFSVLARTHKIDRSLLTYVGWLLDVKIDKSQSHKFSCRQKKPILSSEERRIVIGSLLGDAMIDKYYQFSVGHCEAQLEYIDWLYSKLKNICTRPPVRNIKVTTDKKYVSYKISSYVTDEMEELRNEFYPEGKKIVPKIVHEIDALSLAIWYMDDGGTQWYDTKTKGVRAVAKLFSLGFSDKDHDFLIDILRQKWGLIPRKTKHKSGCNIFLQFSADDSVELFNIMRPHFCSSMLYKIDSEHNE